VPEPEGAVTLIETTDGVTSEAIAFEFKSVPPNSTRVLADEHVPEGERKRALVRLSAHAFTTLGEFVDAVATDPAMAAPAIKAAMTLMFFMSTMLPYFPVIILSVVWEKV
jgi:hypothetical protein